jgi:phage portal protein BeeE
MSEPIDWARLPYATLQRDVRVQRNLARWVTMHERSGHVVRRGLDDQEHARFEAYPAPDGMRTLALLDYLDHPDLSSQLGMLRGWTGGGVRPRRLATVREALGVPAIFRANSLIANVTGSLSMRALKDEVELPPQERPRIVVRPDPNRTPRVFYRDTGWNLGRYGEAWWYVARRDFDGLASALYNIPNPVEVEVEDDPDDPINPVITWRGRSTRDGTLRREDMRHLTLVPDETGLRGAGPLQYCGVATSVAVEAQEWARNFYAGGYPNIWIKTAGPLGGDEDGFSTDEQVEAGAVSEAQRLKMEWISTAPNTPKVTDDSIESITQFDPNPQGAQMLDARDYQNGDAARMYGIPGTILDYYRSGSSLTYQNLDDEFIKWVRLGLRPNYLEPIEQAMSDLLTRQTVARFQTEQLEAPNLKARFEVYEKAIAVFGPEEGAAYARRREGLAPGDVDNAPIPAARPVSIPIAASTTMRDIRCPKCQRLVVRASGSVEGWCRHCKAGVAA